jgi:homoserine O-acetyltransferase
MWQTAQVRNQVSEVFRSRGTSQLSTSAPCQSPQIRYEFKLVTSKPAQPKPQDKPPTTVAPASVHAQDGRQFHSVGNGRGFRSEGGEPLLKVDLAYETWGSLNAEGSNAVLICHALTGDSHATGRSDSSHPDVGWWEALIGPGLAVNTDELFVVCPNVLGGCQGSTGPASLDPLTGLPYGSKFPVVTIRDMVRTQASLATALGVRRWHCVIGGSMGGMQALEWAIMYPDRVRSMVLASSTAKASAQQIAWSHIGRSAIEADPAFYGGDYYEEGLGLGPQRGLAVARMAAQITYRSDQEFSERFDRRSDKPLEFSLDQCFEVESYLEYHGQKLVKRFDANSYLRLNRAMDFHDVGRNRNGVAAALARVHAPALVASVTSDTLYPTEQQQRLHQGLLDAGKKSTWLEIQSKCGHDGFLVETAQLASPIAEFLEEHA